MRVGALVVDPPSREVHLHGQRLALSQKEFALLRLLASDPTRVWTKLELLRAVWGHAALGTSRTLDSHACRLRQKLALRGERWIVNVWGVGYRLLDARTVAGTWDVGAGEPEVEEELPGPRLVLAGEPRAEVVGVLA
jgi:DNA-binding response OmpR family regulator